MAEAAAGESHEIYIWNAEELLNELKEAGSKVAEGTRKALEANEFLKKTLDADVVALTQLVQSGAKIARQIKLLGIMGRAYIKEVGGKKYIIFKGDAKLRPDLKGTRYLAENAKVRSFVVGAKDILEDAGKATKIAIIAFVAIDVIQEVTSDHPSFTSLGVRISSDVLQAVVAGYAGAAAGIVLTTIGAPAVLAFVAVVAVGFGIGMTLTWLDRKYSLTERARARMMGWEQEMEKELAQAKTRLAAAGHTAYVAGQDAYKAGRQYVKEEGIKADKYYQSAVQMLSDSYRLSDNPFMFMP